MNAPVVYRVYDETDRLIYVGATANLPQRLDAHRTQAWWWALAHRVTEEPHADMKSAHEAEWAAIAAENPEFNIARRPGRPPSAPQSLTPADAQVCLNWLNSKRRSAYVPMALRWVWLQSDRAHTWLAATP